MKFNSFVNKLLTDKWVLNIVTILAGLNVIGYLVIGNVNLVLYFIAFAILIRYFSKNMTIVLGVPLLLINLLSARGHLFEGMENKKTVEDTPKKPSSTTEKRVNNSKNKPVQKSSQGLPMLAIAETDADAAQEEAGQEGGQEEGQAGFESGRRKSKGHDIDYAATVEDAYDQLNTILGSDGIQRLTSDTQHLMSQQMQLAKAMESMAPMMESLAPMVNNLKNMMGDSKEGLGGIMKMADKLSGK